MSIIKERIGYNGDDMNLKISMGSDVNTTGAQQAIDKLTQFTANRLVNPLDDKEVRRFKSNISQEFKFKFRSSSGYYSTTYSLVYAGFTNDDISLNDVNLRNSFYVFDFFDTDNPNSQTRLFRGYMSKVKTTTGNARYMMRNTEMNNLYVPISYIESQTDVTSKVYLRILFFNAKTGKMSIFLDEAQESQKNYSKYFFETMLYLNPKTWRILSSLSVTAKEIASDAYTERIKDTISEFENQSQNYPDSQVYVPQTNTYE